MPLKVWVGDFQKMVIAFVGLEFEKSPVCLIWKQRELNPGKENLPSITRCLIQMTSHRLLILENVREPKVI